MRTHHRLLWTVFLLTAVAGIAFFFIPAFIIRPFTRQSASGLAMAMALRDRAPLPTLLAGIVCLLIAVVLWRSTDVRRRIVLGAVLSLVLFSAVMSRLNYFEWMFHPVDTAQFDAASASKLDNSEMILAVRYGSDARAYPIREMAYHHVLNDVVQNTPIAVTY